MFQSKHLPSCPICHSGNSHNKQWSCQASQGSINPCENGISIIRYQCVLCYESHEVGVTRGIVLSQSRHNPAAIFMVLAAGAKEPQDILARFASMLREMPDLIPNFAPTVQCPHPLFFLPAQQKGWQIIKALETPVVISL